jgi:LPS O-antigen subunit length determinant protein (WzzB/FepE family)
MKHWVRLASYLYPAWWRRRYAAEFDALLEEVDMGWRDGFDILKGALTMQLASWNFKSIALTFAVTGAVVAGAIAFRIPSEYQSTSVMRLTSARSSIDFNPYLNDTEQEVLSRTSLEGLITGLDLYKTRRMDTPMENIVQYMRMHGIAIRMLQLPSGEKTPVAFAVTVNYPDPKLAQAVNRALVAKFTAALPHAADLTSLEVLDPPSLPGQPIYPRRHVFVFAGLCGGLLAGLTVAYALRWRIVIERRPA